MEKFAFCLSQWSIIGGTARMPVPPARRPTQLSGESYLGGFYCSIISQRGFGELEMNFVAHHKSEPVLRCRKDEVPDANLLIGVREHRIDCLAEDVDQWT